jgi:hypothetical protein
LKARQSQYAGFEGQSQLADFESRKRANTPILKAGRSLSCRFSKAFGKFKSFSR